MFINTRGNSLIIILTIIGIIIVGLVIFSQLILPKLLNTLTSNATKLALDQIDNIDYSQGQILDINQKISTPSALVNINTQNGKIIINSNELLKTITGSIKYLGDVPDVNLSEDSKPHVFYLNSINQEADQKTISLPKDTLFDILAAAGNGNIDINLQSLKVERLVASSGNGRIRYTMSPFFPTQTTLSVGNGEIVLHIPEHTEYGYQIIFPEWMNVPDLGLGDSFEKITNGYKSKDYLKETGASIFINGGNFNLKIRSY